MSDREGLYTGRKDSHDFGEAIRAIYKDLDRLYGDLGKVYAAVNESGGGVGGGITGPQVQNWEEDRRFRAWLGSHDIADGYEPGTVVDTADWEQAAERTDAMYNRDGDASHAWWYTPAPGDLSGFVYSSPDAGNRRKRIPAVAVGPRDQEHELPVQLDGSFNHTITGNVSGMWDWIIRILEVIGATEYAIPGRADNAFIFNFNAIRNAAPGTIPSVVHARSIYSRLEALEAGGGGGGGGADLTALTNRVSGVEGSVTTLSNDITALQGAVGTDWTNTRTLQALLNDWNRDGSVRHSVSSIDNRLGTLEDLVGHTSRPMNVTDDLWEYAIAIKTTADTNAATLTAASPKIDYLYDDAVGSGWALSRTLTQLLGNWNLSLTPFEVIQNMQSRLGNRPSGITSGSVWSYAHLNRVTIGDRPTDLDNSVTLWAHSHEAHDRATLGWDLQQAYQNSLDNAFGSTLYTGGTIANRLSDLESDVMDLSSGDDAGAVLTALNNHINNDFTPFKETFDAINLLHGPQWDTIGSRPTNRPHLLWTYVDNILDNMLDGDDYVDVNNLEDRVNRALSATTYTGTRTFPALFNDWTDTRSVKSVMDNYESRLGTVNTRWTDQIHPRLQELSTRPTAGDISGRTVWSLLGEFYNDLNDATTGLKRNMGARPSFYADNISVWSATNTNRNAIAAIVGRETQNREYMQATRAQANTNRDDLRDRVFSTNTVAFPNSHANLINALREDVDEHQGSFDENGLVDVMRRMLGVPEMLPDTFTADGVAEWWDKYGDPDRRNFPYLSDFETLLQYLRGWQWEDTLGYSDPATFTYEVARDSDGNVMVNEQGDPVYDLTRRVGWQQILLSLLRAVNPGIGTPEEDLHKIPSVPELSLAAGLDTAALDELKRQLFGERDRLSIAGVESTLVTALEEFLAQIRANTSEIGVNRSNLNRVRDRQIGSPSDPAAAAGYAGLIEARTPTLWEVIERLFRISAERVERLSFGNEYDENGDEIPLYIGQFPAPFGDRDNPDRHTVIDLPQVKTGYNSNVVYSVNDEIGSRLFHNEFTNRLTGFMEESENFISRGLVITARDTMTGEKSVCWGRINVGGIVDGQHRMLENFHPVFYHSFNDTKPNFHGGVPWSDPMADRTNPFVVPDDYGGDIVSGSGPGFELIQREVLLDRQQIRWLLNAGLSYRFQSVTAGSEPDSIIISGTTHRGFWTDKTYLVSPPQSGEVFSVSTVNEQGDPEAQNYVEQTGLSGRRRFYNLSNRILAVEFAEDEGPAGAEWKGTHQVSSVRAFVKNEASDDIDNVVLSLNATIGNDVYPPRQSGAERNNTVGVTRYFGLLNIETRVLALDDLVPNYDNVNFAEDYKIEGRKGLPITPLTLPNPASGNPPYSFRMIDTLPAGLSLNGRVISGTPTVAITQETSYTFEAEDSADNVAGGSSQKIRANIPITIEDNTTPEFTDVGMVGPFEYVATVERDAPVLPRANGGDGTLVYTLERSDGGLLPRGLDYDDVSHTIIGTAAEETADAMYTLTATDDDGDMAVIMFNISVAPQPVVQVGRVFHIDTPDEISFREPLFVSSEGQQATFDLGDDIVQAGGSVSGTEFLWSALTAHSELGAQQRLFNYNAAQDANNPDNALWDVVKQLRLIVTYYDGGAFNEVRELFTGVTELRPEIVSRIEREAFDFTYQEAVTIIEEVTDEEEVTERNTVRDDDTATRRTNLQNALNEANTDLDRALVRLYGPDKMAGGGDGGAAEDLAAAEAATTAAESAYDTANQAVQDQLEDMRTETDLRDDAKTELERLEGIVEDLEDDLAELLQADEDAAAAAALASSRTVSGINRQLKDARDDLSRQEGVTRDRNRVVDEEETDRNQFEENFRNAVYNYDEAYTAWFVFQEAFNGYATEVEKIRQQIAPAERELERQLRSHPWQLQLGGQPGILQYLPGGQGVTVVYTIDEFLENRIPNLTTNPQGPTGMEMQAFVNGSLQTARTRAQQLVPIALAVPLVDDTVIQLVNAFQNSTRRATEVTITRTVVERQQSWVNVRTGLRANPNDTIFRSQAVRNISERMGVRLGTDGAPQRLIRSFTGRSVTTTRNLVTTANRAAFNASSVTSRVAGMWLLFISIISDEISRFTDLIYKQQARAAQNRIEVAAEKYSEAVVAYGIALDSLNKLRSGGAGTSGQNLISLRNVRDIWESQVERAATNYTQAIQDYDAAVELRDASLALEAGFRSAITALEADLRLAQQAGSGPVTTGNQAVDDLLEDIDDAQQAADDQRAIWEGHRDTVQQLIDDLPALKDTRSDRLDDRKTAREDEQSLRDDVEGLEGDVRRLGGEVADRNRDLGNLGDDETEVTTTTRVTTTRRREIEELRDVTVTAYREVVRQDVAYSRVHVWRASTVINGAQISFLFTVRWDGADSFDADGNAIPFIEVSYLSYDHIFLNEADNVTPSVPRIRIELDWSRPGAYVYDEDGDVETDSDGDAVPQVETTTVFDRTFADPNWLSDGVPKLVSAHGRFVTDREFYEAGTFVDSEEFLRIVHYLYVVEEGAVQHGEYLRPYWEESCLLYLRSLDDKGFYSREFTPPQSQRVEHIGPWTTTLIGPGNLSITMRFGRNASSPNNRVYLTATDTNPVVTFPELSCYAASRPLFAPPGPGRADAFDWNEVAVNVGPGSQYRRDKGYEDEMGNPINPYE